MSFYIGNIKIKNKIVLAPMAGYTDGAFRMIAEEMGVGLTYTEMISSEALYRENKKTLQMLDFENDITPVAVQIFGNNPEVMAYAAKYLCDNYKQIKIIDINMGCPVPKVAISSQAGSALLKNPDKIYEIVKKVVECSKVAVTVKIRSGWDEQHINAVLVAKKCEMAGAKAITVHARTRSQGYSGKANWQIIKDVKEAVNIPVIGNGDVTSPELALQMLQETGCDAVMIGRGVLGNPWLIRDCVHYLETGQKLPEVTLDEKIAMMKKHFELLKKNKSLKTALLEIRANILFYLRGLPYSKEIKQQICECKTEKEMFDKLDNYLKLLKKADM